MTSSAEVRNAAAGAEAVRAVRDAWAMACQRSPEPCGHNHAQRDSDIVRRGPVGGVWRISSQVSL